MAKAIYSGDIFKPNGRSVLREPKVAGLATLRKGFKNLPLFYDYTAVIMKDGVPFEHYRCGIYGWEKVDPGAFFLPEERF